jgi:hypothetical protein
MEVANGIDLIKTEVLNGDPQEKEQKSVTIRSGIGLSLNYPQWSHRLKVGGNFTVDSSFKA